VVEEAWDQEVEEAWDQEVEEAWDQEVEEAWAHHSDADVSDLVMVHFGDGSGLPITSDHTILDTTRIIIIILTPQNIQEDA
jgi:hypothetical protein